MATHLNISLSVAAILALGVLSSCGSHQTVSTETDSTKVSATVRTLADTVKTDSLAADATDYETQYVTVADTGKDYYVLQREMYTLSYALKWKIDTMDRYYDARKKKIVLPDTIDDELYRGEYYPRRSTSEFLSLEYYNWFAPSTEYNIALVTGIYAAQSSADSQLALLRPYAHNAFVIKAKVYAGCMH